MIRLTIAILLVVLSISYARACECADIKNLKETQRLSYLNAEVVFVGEFLKIEDGNYAVIRVTEALKGVSVCEEFRMEIVFDCRFIPSEGLNLIYAKRNADGTLLGTGEGCGLSRNFNNPYLFLKGQEKWDLLEQDTIIPTYKEHYQSLRRMGGIEHVRKRMGRILWREISRIRKWAYGKRKLKPGMVCPESLSIIDEIY